jgi:hypothetical protein
MVLLGNKRDHIDGTGDKIANILMHLWYGGFAGKLWILKRCQVSNQTNDYGFSD